MSTLSPTQITRLTSLKNYSTCYEMVLTNGTETRLLGYAHKSGRRLWDFVMADAERIVAFTGASKADRISATEWKCGDWTIKFSGRTEREAIYAGEHARIPAK